MPAGDQLDVPGQIEWAGLLIDVTVNTTSGLWLSWASNVTTGWQPERTSADLETEAGAAPGKRVFAPMYPTILGLCVETDDDVVALLASMAGDSPDPLCWFDRPTNRKLMAQAVPRRCAPSTANGVQAIPHMLVDVQWIIPKPGEIEDIT